MKKVLRLVKASKESLGCPDTMEPYAWEDPVSAVFKKIQRRWQADKLEISRSTPADEPRPKTLQYTWAQLLEIVGLQHQVRLHDHCIPTCRPLQTRP